MIPGMAYLVRRLLENTSNQSWLRAGFFEEQSPEVLLASPQRVKTSRPLEDRNWADSPHPDALPEGEGTMHAAAHHHGLTPAVEGLGDELPMMNEPARDFAQAAVRHAFARAVAAVKVPVVPEASDPEEARQAIAKAAAAFPAWRDVDPLERARVIVRAAASCAIAATNWPPL